MRNSRVLTTTSAIRSSIRSALTAPGVLRVAVPYWGNEPLHFLGIAAKDAPRLQVICNLQSGACDPDAIEELLELGAQVRSLPALHAKVYFGEEVAVVGSANASFRALGRGNDDKTHHGSDEVCVELRDKEELSALSDWFQSEWKKAADLTNPTIRRLLLELARRLSNPKEKRSFVDELTRDPKKFAQDRVFVALDWKTYSAAVEKQVKEANAAAVGTSIDAWQDWPKMPGDAEILSFYYEKDGHPSISYEGCYLTPNSPMELMDRRTRGVLVAEIPILLGRFAIDAHDEKILLKAVKNMNNDRLSRKLRLNGECLHITDFAERYLI